MTREEKERLLAEIEKQYKWLTTKSPTIYMMDIAFDTIRKVVRDEALKQEPVIHAKWERGYSFPDGEYWKCSHCNELIKVKIPMHYCNNCGAKMDKE